ncbi:hypothetical protein EPN42_04795 [bacterium]|nr:MAG: hypothetical protein EPN42_04795 [bacterium]
MNAVMLEPLFGQKLTVDGHDYAFDWDGVSVDGAPARSYLTMDTREAVSLMERAMREALPAEAERAVALAASGLGLSPFDHVPTRELAPVIGETGPIDRARAQSVREAREIFEAAVDALSHELEAAEAHGTTLLVRSELPPDALSRIAGTRVAAAIGARGERWTVVTPQPHEGDAVTLARHVEDQARAGHLQSLVIAPAPSLPLVDVGTVSLGAALAYATFLAPEMMLERVSREPELLEALHGTITVPSALAIEGAERTIGSHEQRQRTEDRSRGMEPPTRDR